MTDDILHIEDEPNNGESLLTNESTDLNKPIEISSNQEVVEPVKEVISEPINETSSIQSGESVLEAARVEEHQDTIAELDAIEVSTPPVIIVNSAQTSTNPEPKSVEKMASTNQVVDTPVSSPTPEPTKKSKRGLWITLIIVVAIITMAAIYFLLYPKHWHALTGKKIADTELVDETDIISDNNTENVADNAKKTTEETKTPVDLKKEPVKDEKTVKADESKDVKAKTDKEEKEVKEVKEVKDVKPVKDTKIVKEEVKKAPIKTSPTKEKSSWDIKLPANVLSFGSFKEEETAKAEVEKLKGQKLKATYFLMSDLQKGKPKLFKVVVGPFANAKEAKAKLETVKKLNDKAFFEVIK